MNLTSNVPSQDSCRSSGSPWASWPRPAGGLNPCRTSKVHSCKNHVSDHHQTRLCSPPPKPWPRSRPLHSPSPPSFPFSQVQQNPELSQRTWRSGPPSAPSHRSWTRPVWTPHSCPWCRWRAPGWGWCSCRLESLQSLGWLLWWWANSIITLNY